MTITAPPRTPLETAPSHVDRAARAARFDALRAHVVQFRPGARPVPAEDLPNLVGRHVVLPTRSLGGIWTVETASLTGTGHVVITATRRNRTRDAVPGDNAASLELDEPVMVLPDEYPHLR